MFKGGYQIIKTGVLGSSSYKINHSGLYDKIESAVDSVILLEGIGYQPSSSDLPLAIAPAFVHFKAISGETKDTFCGLLDSYTDGTDVFNRYIIVDEDNNAWIEEVELAKAE